MREVHTNSKQPPLTQMCFAVALVATLNGCGDDLADELELSPPSAFRAASQNGISPPHPLYPMWNDWGGRPVGFFRGADDDSSVRGSAYEIPIRGYVQRHIDARLFLGGAMGTRGDSRALALSWLPPKDDSFCVNCDEPEQRWGQLYWGGYAGISNRIDHILFRYWPDNDSTTILTRTTFRSRTPNDYWSFFGGTQDFNIYGHGGPNTRAYWKLCFGGFSESDGRPLPCTVAGDPADTAVADPLIRKHLTVPAYSWDANRRYFAWLTSDFPFSPSHPLYRDRSRRFMSRLPVALDASGNRTQLGFIHGNGWDGFVRNHWAGFSTHVLPSDGNVCTQSNPSAVYARTRAFLVTGVPYYDVMGHFQFRDGGLGSAGDILRLSEGERIHILVVAKEHVGIGPEFFNGRSEDGELAPDHFSRVIAHMGGGKHTEVYAFAVDPRDLSRSLFLASANRSDPNCDVFTGTGCDGQYTDASAGSYWFTHFFHRRPERALHAGVVNPTDDGIYHQIYCNY